MEKVGVLPEMRTEQLGITNEPKGTNHFLNILLPLGKSCGRGRGWCRCGVWREQGKRTRGIGGTLRDLLLFWVSQWRRSDILWWRA
eukprot:4304801-Ditylum_brightwellii.AAC.1